MGVSTSIDRREKNELCTSGTGRQVFAALPLPAFAVLTDPDSKRNGVVHRIMDC